ncbi:MAG: hypothetical protein WD793_05670 [Steroidobacteraceae bacterium]
MEAGDIYCRKNFYADPLTGELLPKYLLFMAPTRGGDWVFRLLTSREHGRRREPPCFHGDPYPGYFLGTLGGPLVKDSWVDLRSCPDADVDDVRGLIMKGVMKLVSQLTGRQLRAALECTAAAADTTRQQEQAIRDLLVKLIS